MSKRMLLLAIIAFISAAGTTMMVRSWVASERAAAATTPKQDLPPPPPMSEVLVAADALPAGMILKPQHLRWQIWPAQTVAEGYFVKAKGDMQAAVGSVVRNGIGKGEPILEARIVRPGDRGFLAAILTPGMRATSIPINATSGIAGLIFPGDRVDVILTHTYGENSATDRVRRASETVLQDIRVLATDQRTDHEDGSGGSVAKTATLEVTSKQAEALAMVTELGRLSLSLRSLPRLDEAGEPATEQPASGIAASATAPSTGVTKLAADKPAADKPATDKNTAAKQSYTLDNNVSVLLEGPYAKGKGKTGREVNVIRGKDSQQVTF